MSSIEEKRMMKRSDFAQKLLNDLRVRKEQLSDSHNSQPTDSNYAYSNRGFKGLQVTKAKTQNTFQDFNFRGGIQSNQIVPYGKGRSMEKIDLSKALAFALENVGKATRADPSGNASIISFLHEVGKRSLGERRSIPPSSSSSEQQVPMIHVHIKEISKGAQKLNQIIKACRNGLSFRKGRYSIQCGEELMEGAIELEQSLRLLVDIQQASSDYTTTNKQRNSNRIMLLDENEDDDAEEEDAPYHQNFHKIKQVAKSDMEMRLLALKYPHNNNNTQRKQTSTEEPRSLNPPHKGRIPNVVAKLMGLGEFPKQEKETNDASIKSAENSTRQASEDPVEFKAERRNSTSSFDSVIHKETQAGNGAIIYKAKSQEKNRKRNKVSHKDDGELMRKNVITRNSSPTETKHGRSKRSHHKPSFEKKKLILPNSEGGEEKKKSQRERQHENGVMTNHSPKPFSSMEIQTKLPHKVKPLRKSFPRVELEKKELHKPDILQKKNQDISNTNGRLLCKVTKPPEKQKPNSKEDDQLLKSYQESNQMKTEAETCEVKSSNTSLVEHKREIKDDSILLITAERVQCQPPQDNHHELMFTDGRDQQSPIPKSDGDSERLFKTVLKGANKGDVEACLPLLEKRLETAEKLSEFEINLRKIIVKSQVFLDTAEAFFKLNIPLNVLHDAARGNNYDHQDKNLILDCGYELMKRKGRFQELSVHPFMKVPVSSYSKVNSLDHLVRKLSKELEKLRAYGRDRYSGSLVEEDYLPKLLERDVHHKDPNLNSMWDMGWNDLMLAFIERDDVVRDIEQQVFSKLLEEVIRDLICT